VAFTPEMLAQLEAQRAHFASDEHIQERAATWHNATPEECLTAVIEQCREADYFLSLKTPEELDRLLAARSLPEHTIAILEDLQRQTRR
jgi:hypothetical protein